MAITPETSPLLESSEENTIPELRCGYGSGIREYHKAQSEPYQGRGPRVAREQHQYHAKQTA